MIHLSPPVPVVVRSDPAGDGRFQAPRGSRLHKGLDLRVNAGDIIKAPASGVLSKIGYPYEGTSYRYVQLSIPQGKIRIFYVEPDPGSYVGRVFTAGSPLGGPNPLRTATPTQGCSIISTSK